MTRILAAMITLLCSVAVSAAGPALEQCRQRVHDYAYFWDHSDTEGFAELFTEDATLTLAGQTFSGRTAIVERMAEPGPVMRHLVSTVRVTAAGEGAASGISYVTVHMARPADEGLPETDGFLLIGEYHDRFEIGPDGCRIAERKLVPVMRPKR